MATKVSSNPSMEITPTQQMVSSCTGAMLTSIFVTPLDVVKIRMQSQQKEFMKNKCFLYCNGLMDHVCYCFNGHGKGNICQLHGKNLNYKNSHSYHSLSVKHLTEQHVKDLWYRRGTPFNGTVDAFVKITKNEGVASLWSGLPPTLVMALPATVMYFTIYDQLVAHLRKVYDTETKRHVWIPAVAGGSARAFSATLISPLEMIRTKMQSQKLSYVELGTALKQLVKNEGAISLWKGLTPTILRDVPFSGLYWLNYENIKNHFNQLNPSFGFSFFAGATSGTVAAIVTLPFDVVKTHKQIELGEIEASAQKTKPKNTLQIMGNIFKQNGVRGLFSGLVPRISKVAPACAIMISTYESGKSFFRSYNECNYKSRISNN